MVHRCSNKWNTHGCGHTVSKVVHFNRDVPLIMVKSEHCIKFSTDRSIEDRIRRIRPRNVQSLRLAVFYCRFYLPDLLISQHTSFTTVRIQGGNANPRLTDPPGFQACMSQLQLIDDDISCDIRDGLSQRLMGRKVRDFQAWGHQHRRGQFSPGHASEYLLMTYVTMITSQMHGLLVYRTGDNPGSPVGQTIVNSTFEVLNRGPSTVRRDFALLNLISFKREGLEHHDTRLQLRDIFGPLYRLNRYRNS